MHVFYVILSNKFLLICYANSKPFWPLGKNKKLTTLWNLNYIRGILIRSNIRGFCRFSTLFWEDRTVNFFYSL